MNEQMKRIFRIVRQTKSTLVVTDPDGEGAYAIMDLDQYEKLFCSIQLKNEDDSEEVPLSEVKKEEVFSPKAELDIWSTMAPAGHEGETWDVGKLSDAEKQSLEETYKNYSKNESTTPPSPPEEGKGDAAEGLLNLDDIFDEFGEEQFYLEPTE